MLRCCALKPLAQRSRLKPSFPAECLSGSGPPPPEQRGGLGLAGGGGVIRFHVHRQQNHLRRNHPLLRCANAAHAPTPGALGVVKNIPSVGCRDPGWGVGGGGGQLPGPAAQLTGRWNPPTFGPSDSSCQSLPPFTETLSSFQDRLSHKKIYFFSSPNLQRQVTEYCIKRTMVMYTLHRLLKSGGQRGGTGQIGNLSHTKKMMTL